MRISVCIITKNEEKNIGRCLQCLKPYDFEIVVVDTGSTDRTREIALRYTDCVYDFVWCDDFAAAKNFAVSRASNPYVMVLDSDEFLESIEVERLYRLIKQHPDSVGRIRRRNVFTRNDVRQENREWINRIFPKDRFRYEGRIHEQVMPFDGGTSDGSSAYETYQAPVSVEHTGYDLSLEERKAKAGRNAALLLQEMQRLTAEIEAAGDGNAEIETTDDENAKAGVAGDGKAREQLPYILYQLGKSCYMAEEYKEACEYFSRGLSYDLNPKLEYVIDMVETYGYALINSGQAGEALLFENIYEEFGGSADFQFLMGLIYMNNSRFGDAVKEFEKATHHRDCRNAGVNSYAAYYNIGVIYECLGKTEEAKRYYNRCGDYEPAVKRMKMFDNLL